MWETHRAQQQNLIGGQIKDLDNDFSKDTQPIAIGNNVHNISHQGTVNQNHSGVSFYTNSSGYD